MDWKTLLSALCLLLIPVTTNGKLKKYNINLDLPEEERWRAVTADFPDLYQTMDNVVRELVPNFIFPLVQKISSRVDNYLPKPFAGELRGMAKAGNMSLGDLVLLNLLYDISAHCTSIISQDSTGQIWHSRNLDYRFTEILRKITIQVDFTRGGKVMYSGMTFAGYIGLMTGQRPHAFTISVDERDPNGPVWENAVTAILDKRATLVSFSVRQSLEEDLSFTQAVVRLAERDTIAPVYFIVGGVYPGQGAIITRDRLRPADTWFLDPASGRWFIVETNYDHWKPVPPSDDRRGAANKLMKGLGQKNVDSVHLFKVMTTQPVGNEDTVYTTIMSAGQPKVFSAWVWPLNATTHAQRQHYFRSVDDARWRHDRL